jgi:hypothetical protein
VDPVEAFCAFTPTVTANCTVQFFAVTSNKYVPGDSAGISAEMWWLPASTATPVSCTPPRTTMG